MGSILYIIGLVCAIWCVLDICKKPITVAGKIICSVVVLLTSWIGMLVYYFWARNHVQEWFK